MNYPKSFDRTFLRPGPTGLSMLLALACSTGCPGDDVPTVDTTGEDSTGGSSSTGPSTVTTPTTVTMTGADSTTTGMDTETDTDAETESADSSTGPGIECGDGIAEGDEACDGDDLAGADCMSEGFDGGDISCNDDCTLNTDACVLNCGNGMIDEGEDCDGDDLGGLDCVGLDPAMYMGGELSCADDCSFNVRLCEVITCGDDMIDGMDVCDGTDLGGEDCTTQGFDGGTLACEAGCAAFDTTGCYVCGDDMIGGPETCDGVDLAGEDCSTQGFVGGTLGCAADCGSFDTSMCTTCGDDMTNGADVCDGTDLNGETCITQGFDGGTLGCAADCGGYDTSGCFSCGDGVINGMEVCDGADLGGEDCVTQGFGGGTLGCAADCGSFDTSMCGDPCGNGVIDMGEACDGNDFGGLDCVSQGFLGGGLNCAADCSAIITDACFDNVTTVCSTPGLPIGPDIASPPAVDIIPFVGTGDALVDVDVFVDASHTWSGDMEIDVTYVAGPETVRVFDNDCGNQDNMLVTFDDQAGAPPSCGSPVGGGGLGTPEEPLSAFFNWGDGTGDWEINISDTANFDGGTLNEWCVNLGTNSTAPVCGNGDIEGLEICDDTALASTTCIDLGFTGGSLDCAGNCDFDTSECSNSVIAYCTAPGAPVPPNVLSTINVPDMGTVADVDVFVNMNHVWTSDVDMFISNDTSGTVVELTTDNCGSSDDIWAFFNDEGNGPPDCNTPIAIEGNITPEGVLTDFDGLPIAGDWTLQVNDDFVAADDGVLNEWCIFITPM